LVAFRHILLRGRSELRLRTVTVTAVEKVVVNVVSTPPIVVVVVDVDVEVSVCAGFNAKAVPKPISSITIANAAISSFFIVISQLCPVDLS
jgi:hypothetical protein